MSLHSAIYFNFKHDYRSALRVFLEISHREINHRDLESAIASCYDQLNQPVLALKWFTKVTEENASVLNFLEISNRVFPVTFECVLFSTTIPLT